MRPQGGRTSLSCFHQRCIFPFPARFQRYPHDRPLTSRSEAVAVCVKKRTPHPTGGQVQVAQPRVRLNLQTAWSGIRRC